MELLEKKIKIYSFHDKIIISVAILNDVLDFYFVNHWCFVLQLHSQQHDSRNNRHDVLVDWSRKNNKKRKLSICMLFCCCSCLLNGQVCYLAFFPVGHTLNKLWHFYLFHFFFIYLFIFFFWGGSITKHKLCIILRATKQSSGQPEQGVRLFCIWNMVYFFFFFFEHCMCQWKFLGLEFQSVQIIKLKRHKTTSWSDRLENFQSKFSFCCFMDHPLSYLNYSMNC